jgi:hypothetical protein
MNKIITILTRFLAVINGHFGKYTLVQPYRAIWSCLIWLALIILVMVLILFPLFGLWDKIIDFINHVIWG